ncbi:MAG: hypothetical protein LBL65_07940 [Campylobacteraceae bacterium]|jgi:alpha-tubulin suppressor-like RCC1 family protein|nr:hypothetical protein [Campylobacteraceae bacterium]
MNLKSRVFSAIALISLIFGTNAEAFIPDYPRAVAPGEHHKRITLEALDVIYAGYGYGPEGIAYTNVMKAVRETISQSNANADHNDDKKKDPIWHCDGEQLSQCSNLVKSSTEEGIGHILSEQMDDARKAIGAVTHPLQDFYAHSNWVEMHGSVINNEMGYGTISNVAEPNENTCEYANIPPFTPPALACLLMNDNNIVTSKLTSGYFEGTSGAPLAGVKKCFHGGSFDGLGSEGINKDSSACSLVTSVLGAGIVVSPHNDFHKPAANAANAATVKYFKSIRDTLIAKKGVTEGDKAFKKFLGFGPALGFAIDTTGSMSEEIGGVKAAVSAIVNNRIDSGDEPSHYVLSIINDPNVPEPLVTTESETFLNKLSSLRAGYGGNGGDCPELSGLGTYKAVAVLGTGSNLFVYTDASVKDPSNANLASVMAISKNIKINNSLSGSCSPYDPYYFEISDMTGGQVFIINRAEAGELASLADIMMSGYYTGIMSISGTLTASDEKSYGFKVDSKIDRVSISISIVSGSATASIVRPDGTIVDINDADVKRIVLSSAVVYDISNPQAGEWKTVLEGNGEFSINIAGNSPLSFDSFKFVEYGGRLAHEGFFEISGFPVAGTVSAIEATLSDVTSDVYFELRAKNGELLDTLNLATVDEYPGVKTVFLKEDFVVPNEDFIVYAFGKDKNGVEFQRVLPQKVAPQTIRVIAPFGKELPLDTNTTYTFKVVNYAENGLFGFMAVDDKGFVVSVKPNTVAIDNNESVDINVTLNPGSNSEMGTRSTLTFLAYPINDKKVGNYAVVESTVAKAKPKSTISKSSLITTGTLIDENGDVYVWGFRGSAQQGNGKMIVSSNKPAAKVESLSNVVQLTGGAYHLIALDANGDVWGWGQSGYGETGCEHTIGIYVDTLCKVIGNITGIAAGEYFTIALDNEGKVYTWGHNLYGQLGNGNSKNSQTPVLVNLNGEKARLIGAAYEGAFAVTEEGHVYAWGDNEASGLGFKGTNYGVQKIVRTPTHVTNLDTYANDIVYIAGGNGWGEALLNDGTVIGWGLEAALGQGTTKTSLSSPNPVVILHNVKQLFARYVGSIALNDEGVIYTWGQTAGSAFKHIYGEYASPHEINEEVIEIGGGKEHIFYKTTDGNLYGVGYNDLYKLNLDKLGGIIKWPGVKIEYK